MLACKEVVPRGELARRRRISSDVMSGLFPVTKHVHVRMAGSSARSTMPSVAEITYFKASEDYKSGSISLDGPLAQISKATGLKKWVS